MRIGRNFTNLLEYYYLKGKNKKLFDEGKMPVYDLDALYQIKSKRDIITQIKMAKKFNLSHIELDGGIPNPYLSMTDEEIKKAKKFAKEQNITLSLHLPYTYVAASTCAFQEEDRKAACDMLKKYIRFAAKLGCITCVMHPGSVPFYQAVGNYLKLIEKSLFKSLVELGEYAMKHKIKLHLENNTQFDSVYVHPEEAIPLIQKIRKMGIDIYYNFDIGHWFTHVKRSKDLPNPPESVLDRIPSGLMYEVHLNDYIPEKIKFHPPLHYQVGPLKKKNLKNFARKIFDLGVQIVVVETAVREREELINSQKLLKDESDYLNEIFAEFI